MLDEGQDTFDSHQRAGKIARQSITRTRHMHKKLIIISQRAQAVDVTARGNVSWFYKCEQRKFPFLPPYLKVYATDEIDEGNNYPIWVRHNSQGEVTWKAPVYHSGFARKKIYEAYDSWYMRKNMVRSQDIHVQAYELSLFHKLGLLFRMMFAVKPRKPKVIHSLSTPTQEKAPLMVELGHVDTKAQSYDVGALKQRVVLPIRQKKPDETREAHTLPDEVLFGPKIQEGGSRGSIKNEKPTDIKYVQKTPQLIRTRTAKKKATPSPFHDEILFRSSVQKRRATTMVGLRKPSGSEVRTKRSFWDELKALKLS